MAELADAERSEAFDEEFRRSSASWLEQAIAPTSLLDLHGKCARTMVFCSLVLQAVFQTDETLQRLTSLSEEAMRTQLVILVSSMRTPDLPPKWHGRLAFQVIRLYLLLCRSSHKRKQYVVLSSSFIDEERRVVGFLMSLSPPAQRSCVLLRAMAQDVHSWLLWQKQAGCTRVGATPASSSPIASTQAREAAPRPLPEGPPPAAGAGQPLRRRQRRSGSAAAREKGHAASSSKHIAQSSSAKSAEQADMLVTKPTAKAAAGSRDAVEQGTAVDSLRNDIPPLELFTSGESVWLIHALLVLAFVLFLAAMWRTLESPQKPASGSSWRSSP